MCSRADRMNCVPQTAHLQPRFRRQAGIEPATHGLGNHNTRRCREHQRAPVPTPARRAAVRRGDRSAPDPAQTLPTPPIGSDGTQRQWAARPPPEERNPSANAICGLSIGNAPAGIKPATHGLGNRRNQGDLQASPASSVARFRRARGWRATSSMARLAFNVASSSRRAGVKSISRTPLRHRLSPGPSHHFYRHDRFRPFRRFGTLVKIFQIGSLMITSERDELFRIVIVSFTTSRRTIRRNRKWHASSRTNSALTILVPKPQGG